MGFLFWKEKDESLISNYYDILNVKPTASVDEIMKKFKQKRLETHPDKNKDAQSNFKMQELNEAKRILTSKKLRKAYDQKFFVCSLRNGNNNIAIFFINKIKNLNINEKDNFGNTPLHYAIMGNTDLKIINLLINKVSISSENFPKIFIKKSKSFWKVKLSNKDKLQITSKNFSSNFFI